MLYCATDGDAGKTSGLPVSSRAELGALRRNELTAACQVLGIQPAARGGHPDGALGQTPPETVVQEIVAFLRREKADVVLTFGPEGAPTQHRDHKAISSLATMAFLFAGSDEHYPELGTVFSPKRLCYVTWAQEIAEIYGVNGQPIQIRVDVRPWLSRKRAAFFAHATQRQHEAAFEKGAVTDEECYFVAAGTLAPADASDLFAGLPSERSEGSAQLSP